MKKLNHEEMRQFKIFYSLLLKRNKKTYSPSHETATLKSSMRLMLYLWVNRDQKSYGLTSDQILEGTYEGYQKHYHKCSDEITLEFIDWFIEICSEVKIPIKQLAFSHLVISLHGDWYV